MSPRTIDFEGGLDFLLHGDGSMNIAQDEYSMSSAQVENLREFLGEPVRAPQPEPTYNVASEQEYDGRGHWRNIITVVRNVPTIRQDRVAVFNSREDAEAYTDMLNAK